MIKEINEVDINKVKRFIEEMLSIKVDNNILTNSLVLINNNGTINDYDILGTISYEEYTDNAILRYFIYKKEVSIEEIEELFIALVNILYIKNIDKIITLIAKEKEEVFKKLGFTNIVIDNIIIEEKKASILYEDTLAYIYYIMP